MDPQMDSVVENGTPEVDDDVDKEAKKQFEAAVVFDPTERSFSTMGVDQLGGAGEGECITHDGRMITVLVLCETREEAEEEARKRASEMSSDVLKTDVRHFNGNGLEESGSDDYNYAENGEEEEEEDDVDDLSLADETKFDEGVVDEERYRLEEENPAIDYENQDAIRCLMEVMFQELNADLLRINERQRRMRALMNYYLGGRAAPGAIPSITVPSHRLLPGPPHTKQRWMPKRPRHSLSDDDEDWEADGERASNGSDERGGGGGTRALRRSHAQGRPHYPPLASYPFVSMDEEMQCIVKANGSASEYARRLAKILFKESLHLYFKDQDVKKRQWIHGAVDARFPSDDRQSQATKWKNCSGAINRNRVAEETAPMPARQIDYTYVPKEEEEFAFANCHQDPTKYAELLGMKLFEGTLDRMFRDQARHFSDAVKKEWLRECVDIRFPLGDKLKRDGRWKVCASAVNRNRNKAVDTMGTAVAYPYITQEIEERCFAVAKDNVALYAELLGRLMFKPTRDLMFKDQDPKMRQWVHDIIDRRYPTPDKARHSAKWKTCSSAINKARFTADYPMPWEHGKGDAGHLTTTSTAVSTPTSISTENDAPVAQPSTVTAGLRNTRRSTAAREAAVTVKKEEDDPVTKKRRLRSTGLPYPFITEEEEAEIFDKSAGNVQTYARKLAAVLFKDSLELYFKDQEPKKRDWLRMIVDYRFPTADKLENLQKWKSCSGAINKNRMEKRL